MEPRGTLGIGASPSVFTVTHPASGMGPCVAAESWLPSTPQERFQKGRRDTGDWGVGKPGPEWVFVSWSAGMRGCSRRKETLL